MAAAAAAHRRDLPPETERQSHYFGARLPEQFDAMIHIDETRALTPAGDALGASRGSAGDLPHGM
jgi:hypothetical protein